MKKAVSREVAIDDCFNFVNNWLKKPIKKDEVEDKYLDILEAVEDGYLTFTDSFEPKYTLKQPIKNSDGDIAISEISFVTRIKPTTMANLGKGLNLQTDTLNLQLRMVAHIIGQPIAILDTFGRYDYDVLGSIASVFS